MHKVIAFDLDGTLIDENNQIIGGQKTLNQLKILHEEGYKLVINTGRLDHDIDYILNQYQLPVDARISQNGAVIFFEDSLEASLLDKDEALRFYQKVKNLSIRVEMNTVSNRYWHVDRDPSFPKEFYDSSHIVENFEHVIKNQPVVLFLLIGDECEIVESRKLVEELFPKLQAVQTSDTSLEVLSQGVSKGNALVSLFGSMELFAIGDSENDYSMFEEAKHSYLISEKSHSRAQQIDSIDLALDDIIEIINKDLL